MFMGSGFIWYRLRGLPSLFPVYELSLKEHTVSLSRKHGLRYKSEFTALDNCFS